MKMTLRGRASGLPVVVQEVSYDGEEYQCPGCEARYTSETMLVAHVVGTHPRLVVGANPGEGVPADLSPGSRVVKSPTVIDTGRCDEDDL